MRIEGRVLLPSGIAEAQIEIEENRIAQVLTDTSKFKAADLVLRQDQVLCPGFIDAQINGGFGKEFKTDTDAVEHVASRIPEFGTTSIMPTITTRPVDTYSSHLAALMDAYSGPGPNARVLGVHLEGPALNAVKRGAHPENWIVPPTELDLDAVVTADVRMVTLAPEMPGGWHLAEDVLSRGLKLGIGHSLASYGDILAHVATDDVHVVHVFNAMGDLTAREPGLPGIALSHPEIHASVIADLIHVHPANLKLLWNARGGQRLFGVSDGSAVLGLPPGIHEIGVRTIERRQDRAVLHGTETLVGSVLTMNVAARNLRQVTGCSFEDAVGFVTINTATYLGLADSLGSIVPGLLADLCVIDANFDVYLTIIDGAVAFDGALP